VIQIACPPPSGRAAALQQRKVTAAYHLRYVPQDLPVQFAGLAGEARL